jgi:hypothetical protein
VWDLLRDLSCDEAQGFHMSRPLPAHEFAHWAGGWAVRHSVLGTKGIPNANVTLH